MKISTKGRYALRIMLELATRESGEYISLKDVSASQAVSDKYSEQIINQLNKAGFVKSTRGSRGGYMLADDPKNYTVGMILRLMEGSLAPVPCIESKTNTCERAERCVTVEVWQKLNDAINDVVDNITLEDLVKRHNEKCK